MSTISLAASSSAHARAVPDPVMAVASRRDVPVSALELLDDPQEWGAFGQAMDEAGGRWESHLVIEGMHCAACALTLEDVLRTLPGVLRVDVSAASRRARIVWSPQQGKPSDWLRAVERAGYRALPANDIFASRQRRLETRRALWRWVVAGLCMMQVMMYAWPAYVAEPGDLSAEMERLLRWASWVLTLPVLFFSCKPFFANAWRDVMQRRISMDLPVALGILITFGVSSAGTFEPQGVFGREVYFDSLTMFVFFLLSGRWLEMRLRERTAGALDAVLNRLPEGVLRDNGQGGFERVAIRRLQVGDRIRVLPGEVFPADGRVEQGQTQVDEALLSGESHPLMRGPGCQVVAGSHNLSAAVLVQVEQVGAQTRFAEIAALMEQAATSKPRLAARVDRLARPFLFGVLMAATVAAVYWWPQDPGRALMVAVSVLVVTCPCALSLATPAAMLAAAGALAKQGVLVRNLGALESLAEIRQLVFDKTGTLTRDVLVLGPVQVRAGGDVDQALTRAMALAQHSLHPVSRALMAAGHARGLAPQALVGEFSEAPGQGVIGGGWRLGSAAFCGVSVASEQQSQVCLCDEQGWYAGFDFLEDVRPDAAQTVTQLQAQGVQVRLLSGDSAPAVVRVAQQLGIAQARGGCTPRDKLDVVQALQRQGQTVAMVGDGLNDGPVLAAADVSFSVGQAVPLAQAKADFVILGDQLHAVVQTLQRARLTLRIVRQNLGWAVGYNLICVPLAVAGWMPAWLAGLGMAASSLLVVLNALRLTRFRLNGAY